MTDFTEPAEYADLRAAIREITLTHGPAEYAEHGRTSTPMTGLWGDLGKAGFIGINVPAEFGGGGAGMAELAMVAEESGRRVPAADPAGVERDRRGDLRRHGSR